MQRKLVLGAVGLAAVASLTLSGCQIGGDKANEQFKDAPRTGQVNDSAATVGTMPDGFGNWAEKCDNGNRVYTLFHNNGSYGSIAVVPNAKGC